MVINMENPNRKSNRIAGYDYSQSGAYFVTICTQDRKKILSKISVGTPREGCPYVYAAASNIFSMKMPYPVVGSFTKTWVTAPTSLPS